MSWACPDDHSPLEPSAGDTLRCPRCAREYPLEDGVAVFAARDRQRPAPPEIDALLTLLERRSPDEAAAEICRQSGCSRSPYSADWKFFFSVPAGGTTLELGAGFGDDSRDLAGPEGVTLSVVPSMANARILRRRRAGGHAADWPIAVLDDVTRLPLPGGAIDAVALEDVAAPGFRLDGPALARAAVEWKRVLVPGGVVFLGVANRLHRLPGVATLRSALRARQHPTSLNRWVKRRAAPDGAHPGGLGQAVRAFVAAGFGRPVVYAPLPDENESHVVLPVEDARVVRYFLDNLVRRNSRAVRVGLRLAHAAVSLNVFHRLTPYYYLIFRAGAAR